MILTCTLTQEPIVYPIHCLSDLFEDLNVLVNDLKKHANKIVILCDDRVASLYGETLRAHLGTHIETSLFHFPSGEIHKTRETKASLEDQLHSQSFGRDTALIALGGGITCDLAGYIAATYCRGIPLFLVPTSLLAMVDACIGGKTAVNLPWGKNLVGTIYQPKSIWIATKFLETLPLRELRCGFSEMIKHALIADAESFSFLETHVDELLSLRSPWMEKALIQSLKIKKAIVEVDEKESGMRHLLNLGHTIGHALEKVTDHLLPHGEAIAIGILVECHISHLLGFLSKDVCERIRMVFAAYAIPLWLPKNLSQSEILESLKHDKKALHQSPRFSLIEDIGSPLSFEGAYCTPVPDSVITTALDWMVHDLCRH